MPYEMHADAPLVLEDPDSHHLVSGWSHVMDATIQYFTSLYHHIPSLPTPKPWLNCAQVNDVKTRVLLSPFTWPRCLPLNELRSLLRRAPMVGKNGALMP